jgi:hypothetical protein
MYSKVLGYSHTVLAGETGRPEAAAERKDGKEQVEREGADNGRWGEGDEGEEAENGEGEELQLMKRGR